MRNSVIFIRTVSLITLFFFIYACSVRTVREVSKDDLNEVKNSKTVVLHNNDLAIVLDKAVLTDGKLSGFVKKYIPDRSGNNVFAEVHIFLKNPDERISEASESVSIMLDDIARIEIYDIDTRKAVVNFTGVTVVVVAVLCVFLYNFVPRGADYN